MKNRFAALCCRCGKPVPMNTGHILGKPGAWEVTHTACVPVLPPKVRELEHNL